jgi:hypothetical protein
MWAGLHFALAPTHSLKARQMQLSRRSKHTAAPTAWDEEPKTFAVSNVGKRAAGDSARPERCT